MPEPFVVAPDLAHTVLDALDLAIEDLQRKVGEPRVYRVVPSDVAGLEAKIAAMMAARDRLRGQWRAAGLFI
jgi:hypothetical protein